LSVVLFFVTGRFRVPMVPLLIIFAAHGSLQLVQVFRAHDLRQLLGYGSTLLLLMLFCNSSFFCVRTVDQSRQASLLAYAHEQLGDQNQALRYYQEALHQNPSSLTQRYHVARVLLNLGRAAEALGELEAVHELLPHEAVVVNSLGMALAEEQRLPEALKRFQAAIELDGNFATAYRNLAVTHVRMSDWPAANQAFEKAIEVASENDEYRFLYGFALNLQGRQPEALEQFQEAVRLNPKNTGALEELAALLVEQRDPASAERALRQAIAVDPKRVSAHSQLGFLLGQLGNFQEAIQVYRSALELNPNLPEVHYNLAVAFLVVGEYRAAWRHVHLAQQLGYTPPPDFIAELRAKLPEPQNP
ncbi:MAG: tetratricopeptide repeat protein, partial [Planctomycetota bacterium]